MRPPTVLPWIMWTASAIAPAALVGMPAVASGAPVLRVRVNNYATAPVEAIAEMESAVGRLFAEAGVMLEWLQCYDSAEQVCPGTVSPGMLVLRIMPGRDREVPQRLGGAIHPNYANVWYGRVLALPAGHRTAAEVLAWVAAHELGHLLPGQGGHCRNGVMRPAWRDTDPADALPGRLQFSAEQRRMIRLNSIARTAGR